MTLANWKFTSEVNSGRAARLLQLSSFDDVINLIVCCEIEPMWWEPATAGHLAGCNRASFKMTVSEHAYDAFFNSPVGYRGQFALGEYVGEVANRKLINSLLPKLISAVSLNQKTLPIHESLMGNQAKIWIVESEVEEQLGNKTPSIDYEQWEFNEHDCQGLRAPIGTKLELKGAWINSDGKEIENHYKRSRSSNIYRTGDSK